MVQSPYKNPDSELRVNTAADIPEEILDGIKHAWLAPLIICLFGVAAFIYYFFSGYQGTGFIIKSGAAILVLLALSLSFYLRAIIPAALIILTICVYKIWEFNTFGKVTGIGGLAIVLYFSIKGFISIRKIKSLQSIS